MHHPTGPGPPFPRSRQLGDRCVNSTSGDNGAGLVSVVCSSANETTNMMLGLDEKLVHRVFSWGGWRVGQVGEVPGRQFWGRMALGLRFWDGDSLKFRGLKS